MSAMAFREPNRARRVGVRPAHDGTQVYGRIAVTNSTSVVYTPSGILIGYITFVSFSSCSGVTSGTARIVLRDASDVIQWSIIVHTYKAIGQLSSQGTFNPPLEVPNGWDIAVIAPTADHTADGSVEGWEE